MKEEDEEDSKAFDFCRTDDVCLNRLADSDFLPPKTFTRILARHGARLPPPLISPSASSPLKVDGKGADDAETVARRTLESLSARWVLKVS